MKTKRIVFVSGLILLGLSSPFAIAQDNSRNVLVVFSSMERDHKSLDLIESAVRARFR